MDDYPYEGKYFSVRKCPDIGQMIVALECQPTPASGPWADFAEEIGNLQIALGDSQADARAALWPLSRAAILAGCYSYSDGSFRVFSPKEREAISAALAS
jgi:hypothetical protein